MFFQLVFLLFCQTILADRQNKPFYDTDDYEVVGRHFEKFIRTYQKQYDDKEKAMRFQVFIENLKEINTLNKRNPLPIFDIGIFADTTQAEKRMRRGLKPGSNTFQSDCQSMDSPTTKDAPDALDYRDQNLVSPVKDQQNCGSCWAFSATALVESRCLQKGKTVSLSEQQLVDCTDQSDGCNGGLSTEALAKLLEQKGQESEDDYPYTAVQGSCQFDSSKVAAQLQNCTDYSISDENVLKELLFKEGPLSIGVAADGWDHYPGRIFEDCQNGDIDHAVLLVGYGTDNGEDFWVIKNSWGTSFGESGFIRIKRGVNCCSIGSTDAASAAVL